MGMQLVQELLAAGTLFDAARDPFNEVNKSLLPNIGNADDTSTSQNDLDFL